MTMTTADLCELKAQGLRAFLSTPILVHAFPYQMWQAAGEAFWSECAYCGTAPWRGSLFHPSTCAECGASRKRGAG